ncbi:MAG: hypothetical protein JRH16_19930 [Deltaproteobacteria bacterium]|nr:hypothetical protein [Deltaproteobacteria bacterium]MBW2420049.1 hypothetical protein [Deltaproteobacteria bacterium]
MLGGAAILLAVALTAVELTQLFASLDAQSALLACLGLAAGAFAIDAITGLVHWACDTWGSEDTRWIGPGLIHGFREHHANPRAMLDHDWIEVNREPALAVCAALLLARLPGAHAFLEQEVFAHAVLCAMAVYGAAANQLHWWAHMDRPPAPIRLAQRSRLVLSPGRHAQHHGGRHAQGYCISTGWLNPLLDRMGFWRALERCVSRLTGATPRSADAG